MPSAKPFALAVALLTLSVLVAAWMFRLNVVPTERSVIVLDRWSGHVHACNARECVRIYPEAPVSD